MPKWFAAVAAAAVAICRIISVLEEMFRDEDPPGPFDAGD